MTLTETDGDDRIVRESGIDARIALIVQPVLRGAGFRLVRVRLSGQHGARGDLDGPDDGSRRPVGCVTVRSFYISRQRHPATRRGTF